MSAPIQSLCRNRLLALMPAESFARLAPHLESVRFAKGHVLVEADAPIEYVHFLETGIASVVARSPEGLEVEAGLYGREGFGPVPALLGSERAIHRILLQVPDDAYQIERNTLLRIAEADNPLRLLLLRFTQVLAVQTAFTALSNAVHPIDERLARWLLMCHDRHPSDDIPLTHEFLSLMLAVRRPSVTTALHVLEGNGFIRAERGNIMIRNRPRLEEFAGDSYGRPEAEYRRLIGPMN